MAINQQPTMLRLQKLGNHDNSELHFYQKKATILASIYNIPAKNGILSKQTLSTD